MLRKDISELIKKYEERLLSGKSIYFDADEFEDLAEYYDQQENIDSARDVIEAGLKIHPESSALLLKRAKFLVYDGEYSDALNLLNNTLNEYDFDLYLLKTECFLQLGLLAEAHSMAEEILENEEDYIDNALAELGFLYLEADLFAEAILYFEKSLEYNPVNGDVLSDLAYAYEMEGEFEKAVNTNNKILDIDAYSYEAWVNIGRLYSVTDEFEKAVDAFDFALTINDTDRAVLKLKAHCLSLCGRGEEAIAIFKDLAKEMPEDTSVQILLSECYFALEMYDAALIYLDKYEELEGRSVDIVSKKAYIYLQKGEYDTVLNLVASVYDDAIYSSDLNAIIGEVKYKQGFINEAEEYFLKAYNENKDNSYLVDRLSILNIKKEDYSKALEYAKELLDLEPYNSSAKQRLVLLYFELDNEEEFNELLDQFSDENLLSLFNLIYDKETATTLDRQQLINALKEARECRILFKNLKY